MKANLIDKANLARKQIKVRKIGKNLFDKAENLKNKKQIRKSIKTALFALNDLSPKYISVENSELLELQNSLKICLEQIATVEHFHRERDFKEGQQDSWYVIVAPWLKLIGDELSKTYFDCSGEKLEIVLPTVPDKDNQRFYPSGSAYQYYQDLSSLIIEAKEEVVIADRYLNEELFSIYLDKITGKVKIRILTYDKIEPKFIFIAKKFKQKPDITLELRKNPTWHDRFIFIDNSCWVSGQTIKDAAGRVPTYLIKLNSHDKLKMMFEEEWVKSEVII